VLFTARAAAAAASAVATTVVHRHPRELTVKIALQVAGPVSTAQLPSGRSMPRQ